MLYFRACVVWCVGWCVCLCVRMQCACYANTFNAHIIYLSINNSYSLKGITFRSCVNNLWFTRFSLQYILKCLFLTGSCVGRTSHAKIIEEFAMAIKGRQKAKDRKVCNVYKYKFETG